MRTISKDELRRQVIEQVSNIQNGYVRHLTATNELMELIDSYTKEAVQPWAELLEEFIWDEDDCYYDHEGLCQSHNLHKNPCPHTRAKKMLKDSIGILKGQS